MNAKRTSHGSQRALTLLEMMIFVSVFSLLAVATMRCIGDGRLLRGNARDRSVMTAIAQSELERVRTMPAGDLNGGRVERRDPSWPSGTVAAVELTPRPDGTWLVDVTVTRDGVEGRPSVRLATIRTGGAS
jgi:type II secretory pathway pseudopilin PulG